MEQRFSQWSSADEDHSLSTESYKYLFTVAPQPNYTFGTTSTLNGADARPTQTRSGQTTLLPSEERLSRALLRWRFGVPSADRLPRFSFLSGFICSVRARSISRPGAGIDWLRHRRRKSFRVPMGVGGPRPLHLRTAGTRPGPLGGWLASHPMELWIPRLFSPAFPNME